MVWDVWTEQRMERKVQVGFLTGYVYVKGDVDGVIFWYFFFDFWICNLLR
jgi:hypothetical protein